MFNKNCRTCKHKRGMHLDNGTAECNAGWLNPTKLARCYCYEYIPNDNLEYLEWVYNKKEKQCL